MQQFIFKELAERGLMEESEYHEMVKNEAGKPISLHTDLRMLMYAGVILLSSGLGILIYQNIHTIGHLTIVWTMAAAMLFCFGWSWLKAAPFTWGKPPISYPLNDYLLLMACLLLLVLTGYLQFQYNLFGNRWGLATFIPMCILFVCAYYFDHLGVLSMAVLNLGAWAGIAVTPQKLLLSSQFNDAHIIYTGVVLGLFLLFISYVSASQNVKAHFAFSYKNLGLHLLFIANIAGIMHFGKWKFLWLLMLAAIGFWQFFSAKKERSFYFLTIVVLYCYFGLSYVVVHYLFYGMITSYSLYLALFYFIITAVGCVALLMRYNKILKTV